MAIEPIITWHAPEHLHFEKRPDWYWSVGIITLALSAVCIIFGNVITGIFVLVAATALVLHASKQPKIIECHINDRGVVAGNIIYPFLSLESFWIAHESSTHGMPPKIILKSRKLIMPYIIIYIDEVDPEDVREVLLRYIAETEHHESFLKHLLENLGF